MSKTTIALAMAASLAMFAGSAGAEPADERAPEGVLGVGEEESGFESAESGHAAMSAEEAMSNFDLNENGELSEAELMVFGVTAGGHDPDSDPGKVLLEKLDDDGDGVVDQQELKDSDLINAE